MSQLFDRIIDLTFVHQDSAKKPLNIKTPRYGLKPKITVSWNRVPGNFCYNCQIQVTNMFLNWNIYDIASIVIEAGYTSLGGTKTVTLDCQVFDAYRSTPGPDGATVFDCLTAAANSSLFNQQPYHFLYYNKQYTIAQVLLRTAEELQQADANLIFMLDLVDEEWLKSTSWNDTDYEDVQFSTGYGLLDYIQRHLSQLAYARNKHKIYMTVFGNKVIFEETDEKGNPCILPPSAQQEAGIVATGKRWLGAIPIPKLDHATDITYTAGTLTAVAPWNPDIFPGCTFYCNPKYYTGGTGLPNQIIREGKLKDKDDLYYCLTQKVTFSTTDNTNEMRITAVQFSTSPAKNVLDVDAKEAKELDKEAESLKKRAEKLNLTERQISFGDKQTVKNSELNKAVSGSATFASKRFGSKTYYSLSAWLDAYAEDADIKAFRGYPKGKAEVSIAGKYFYYPFVALATAQVNEKISQYDPNKPDLITDATTVAVPSSIADYASYAQNTDVIQWFRKFADATRISAPEWASNLLLIADILENGEVINE